MEGVTGQGWEWGHEGAPKMSHSSRPTARRMTAVTTPTTSESITCGVGGHAWLGRGRVVLLRVRVRIRCKGRARVRAICKGRGRGG